MTPVNRRKLAFAGAVALCLITSSPRATAQAVQPAPRTAAGKPDLTGVYQSSPRRGAWDFETPGDEPGRPAPRTAGDVRGPGAPREPIPLREDARKQAQEYLNRRSIDDPTTHCIPQASPRITPVGLFPIQFVQGTRELVILYEYLDEFRVIPIDGRGHPADMEPTYKGDSVGRWEGDTLVVDVVNFKPGGWISSGIPTSDQLHLTERFTRIDRDQLNYEVTIEDPKILTKPWKMGATLMLREGTHLREYVCVENNLDPDRYEKLLSNPSLFLRSPDATTPQGR